MEPSVNPYESPTTPPNPPPEKPATPRAGWRRGILFAVAGGLYGFYIPLVVMFGIGWVLGIPVWLNPFQTFWGDIIAGPQIYLVCSAMCASAALLNYTPARPIGMFAALRKVGGLALLGMLLPLLTLRIVQPFSDWLWFMAIIVVPFIAIGGLHLTAARVQLDQAEPLESGTGKR